MASSTGSSSISELSKQCHAALDALCSELEAAVAPEAPPAVASKANSALGRFNLWQDEVQSADGSLDHALRKASHLNTQVSELLQELRLSADDAQATLSDDFMHPGDKDEVYSLRRSSSTDSAATSVLSSASSSDRFPTVELRNGIGDSPRNIALRQALSDIMDIIDNLFQLSPSLRDPAPYDSVHREGSSSVSHIFDSHHIEMKFPKADKDLAARLGRAAWHRRQDLMSLQTLEYRPLPYPGDDVSQAASNFDLRRHSSSMLRLSEAGKSSSYSPYRKSSGTGSDTRGHSARDSTFSMGDSSKATALTSATSPSPKLSRSSSLAPQPRPEERRRYLPRPPEPNEAFTGDAFQCPYCSHTLVNVKSSKMWRRHVMKDLEPYLCTFGDCIRPDKTYGIKKDWKQHEHDFHRSERFWSCRPCSLVCHAKATFEQHIRDHHPEIASRSALRMITEYCEGRRERPVQEISCPLCMKLFTSQPDVMAHIADDLEQVALFALPAGMELDEQTGLDLLEDSGSEGEAQKEHVELNLPGEIDDEVEPAMQYVRDFLAAQAEPSSPSAMKKEEDESMKERGSAYLINALREPPMPPPGVRKPSIAFPVNTMTYPRHERFFGQDGNLAHVHEQLRQPGLTCTIYGVGGVGKTLFAVEYAYRFQKDYDCVFWLQADTEPGLTESHCLIARGLGMLEGNEDQAQIIEIGRDWLETTDKRWLLIVDNVEEWDGLLHYLPMHISKSQGSVLLTTQHTDIKAHTDVAIPLKSLEADEGGRLLFHLLDAGHQKEEDDEELAREISQFVGGLPVAIAHVAGYIAYSQCPLDELLEIFQQRREHTRPEWQASFSYDETLAIVWNIALRELPGDCQDLIYILSYLNGECVPEKLIWAAHTDPGLEFLHSDEKIRRKRLRRMLLKRRLIQSITVNDEACLSIHRALQRNIRDTLSKDPYKELQVFNRALTLVRQAFPSASPIQVPEPDKWPQYQRLLPHVYTLRNIYVAAAEHFPPSSDFAQVLASAGMNMWERGITKDGSLLLRTAEKMLDQTAFDKMELLRADVNTIIALMCDNTGVTQRAEGLRRRRETLEIRQAYCDERGLISHDDEVLLYNAKMDLVCSLLQYNNYAEAEPILEDCLAQYQKWGEEEAIPFEYAKYYHNMALVRMYQERFDEAIHLAGIGVFLMGKASLDSLSYRYKFDQACIALQSGQVAKALEMHEEILQRRSYMCGQSNELTLNSCFAVGVIYEQKGDLDKADALFRRALDRRRAGDWSEEAIARTQFHLARVLVRKGAPEKQDLARKLFHESRHTLKKLLPLDPQPWLEGVEDEEVLFDHLLTTFEARFSGTGLLKCFLQNKGALRMVDEEGVFGRKTCDM